MAPGFPKKDELDAYLARIEEATKRTTASSAARSFRSVHIHDEGPGFLFSCPTAWCSKKPAHRLLALVSTRRLPCRDLSTPIMLNQDLWHRSGHWITIKIICIPLSSTMCRLRLPMNPLLAACWSINPVRILTVDLLRVGELGIVHRHELSRRAARSVPRPLLHAGRCAHLHDT